MIPIPSMATDLTIDQIGKIYSGEITNWKEVGGSDAPIVCIPELEPVGLYVTFIFPCSSI